MKFEVLLLIERSRTWERDILHRRGKETYSILHRERYRYPKVLRFGSLANGNKMGVRHHAYLVIYIYSGLRTRTGWNAACPTYWLIKWRPEWTFIQRRITSEFQEVYLPDPLALDNDREDGPAQNNRVGLRPRRRVRTSLRTIHNRIYKEWSLYACMKLKEQR